MATESFDQFDTQDLENGPFGMLIGLNPARLDYLHKVLNVEFADELQQLKVLDIGCGIGLLTLPLAETGCTVSAVDPSLDTLAVARDAAQQKTLNIDFRKAPGEKLPYSDGCFDVVTCCDVLEHVNDLELALSETARVLRPGGVYIFGTLNRTFESWLLAIKVLQDWSWTRVLPSDLHRWSMFIKPRELVNLMTARNLHCRELIGLRPGSMPLSILKDLRACKRGEITASEFGRRLKMRPCRSTRLQYLGCAVKR